MRPQVLEVTLTRGRPGRTSRKERKRLCCWLRLCCSEVWPSCFLYSAQSGQYVEDHARRARRYSSTLAKLEKRIATLQQLEASIAINPCRSAAVSPEKKQELPQTWDRAPEPAEKPSSPSAADDPPSSLGYSDDNPKERFA